MQNIQQYSAFFFQTEEKKEMKKKFKMIPT